MSERNESMFVDIYLQKMIVEIDSILIRVLTC